MVRVNSCFGCIQLHTAGKIFAWLGMIGNGLLMFIFGILLIVCISSFESMCKPDSVFKCDQQGIAIAACLIICLFTAIDFYFAILLLQGINELNHKKILPTVIIYGINLILELLAVPFSGSLEQGVSSFCNALFTAYIFLVLYSIYKGIKEDKVRPGNIA